MKNRLDEEITMEWVLFLKAVLALAFVLGLMLLTLWAVKYLEVRGVKNRFMRRLQNERRIDVVEVKRIDARNSLVLVRRDDSEYLLVLGSSQNLVLDANIKVKK